MRLPYRTSCADNISRRKMVEHFNPHRFPEWLSRQKIIKNSANLEPSQPCFNCFLRVGSKWLNAGCSGG